MPIPASTGFKTLSFVRHPTDENTNRVIDELSAKLNPLLRQLPNKIPPNIPPNIGAQPTVTGSQGSGAALTSLLAQLVELGLIIDGTVP